MNEIKLKKRYRTIFLVFIAFFIVTSFFIIDSIILPSVVKDSNGNFISSIISLIFLFAKSYFVIILGIIVGIVWSYMNWKFIADSKWSAILVKLYIYVVTAFNIWVAFFSSSTKGAKRWINFGIITIQPSELTKLSFIFLAFMYIILTNISRKNKKNIDTKINNYLSKLKGSDYNRFIMYIKLKLRYDIALKERIKIILIYFVNLGLILYGKALSNTITLFLLFNLLLIFNESMEWFYFVFHIIAVSIGVPLLFALGKFQHVVSRLENTNSLQSVYSQASYTLGGIFGLGPDRIISKYFYLPELENDYVLATIGEMYGFIGVIFILLSLIVFSLFLYRLSLYKNDIMHKVILQGFCFIVFNQTILHWFITTGSISTGILLPFYGKGGSFAQLLSGLIILTLESINSIKFEK